MVARRTRRLHDENIRTPNIFSDRKIELAIRKAIGNCLTQVARKMPADLFCKIEMGGTRKDLDVACYAHSVFSSPHAVGAAIAKQKRLTCFKQAAVPNSE